MSPADPTNTRVWMLTDLIAKQPLIGMSEGEVLELLGPYTFTHWNDEVKLPGWWLGRLADEISGDRVAMAVNVVGGRIVGFASPLGVQGVLPEGTIW